nr:hypothetical protein C5F59_39235 [Streptomyces sp. QL37]
MAGVGGADAPGPWLDGGRGETNATSHKKWPDPALTRAVREAAGDVAPAELYGRHGAAVQAYARMCCRDVRTAEDLASEAFVRTIQAVRAGGRPEASWRPYLLAVIRRTASIVGGGRGGGTRRTYRQTARDQCEWSRLAHFPRSGGAARRLPQRTRRTGDPHRGMPSLRRVPRCRCTQAGRTRRPATGPT